MLHFYKFLKLHLYNNRRIHRIFFISHFNITTFYTPNILKFWRIWQWRKCLVESKAGAVKYIKGAADKGHTKANLKYGEILLEGNGVKSNIKEALKYLKYAADNGKKQAMFLYGKIIGILLVLKKEKHYHI